MAGIIIEYKLQGKRIDWIRLMVTAVVVAAVVWGTIVKGPTVHSKTYIFCYFDSQYLVLFTTTVCMVPRNTITGDHSKYLVGPTVHTKTYISPRCFSQYLVLFTIIVPCSSIDSTNCASFFSLSDCETQCPVHCRRANKSNCHTYVRSVFFSFLGIFPKHFGIFPVCFREKPENFTPPQSRLEVIRYSYLFEGF